MLNKYFLSTDEDDMDKVERSKAQNRVQCRCGAKTTIAEAERKICYRCGHWVYRDDKVKFKYEMLKKLREAKTNGY